MKVILIEDVKSLGKKGQIVDVRYSLALKDAVYIIAFEDKTKSEIPASMMDRQKIKNYLPMSALL